MLLFTVTVLLRFTSTNSLFTTKAQELAKKEIYDCYPDVQAKRLGIECELEGDKNAALLAIAIVRCRMPPNWAPDWKCSTANTRELGKCKSQDTSAMVFSALAEAYFEVFEYCKNKVSEVSMELIEGLAESLAETSEEAQRLQKEQIELIDEVKRRAETTKLLQRDASDVIDEVLDARQSTLTFADEMASMLERFSDTVQGAVPDQSTALVVVDGGDVGDVEETCGGKNSISDALQALRALIPGRSKSRISGRDMLILYFMAVMSVVLASRRGRFFSWLYEMVCFSIVFYMTTFIGTVLVKAVLWVILAFTLMFTSAQ